MRFFLALTIALTSLGALAQNDLDSMKQKANTKLDKKMASLQEAKTCINAATTVDKFKACKYDMYEDMKKTKKQAMEEEVKEMPSEE
ncbi:MAG: hypothetical protein NDI69_08525 [Bacteriovoracaceae bacterium]|nr:hypothetical protein [Bacteriovoracaceae bacterium]